MRIARPRRRGFTLIEVIVATVLVSLLVTGSMVALTQTVRGRTHAVELAIAERLAESMSAEMRMLPRNDPQGSAVLGPELGETGTNRERFDDFDDYLGVVENPPRTRSGEAIPEAAGWKRQVTFIQLSDPLGVLARGTIRIESPNGRIFTYTLDRTDQFDQWRSGHRPLGVEIDIATTDGDSRQTFIEFPLAIMDEN